MKVASLPVGLAVPLGEAFTESIREGVSSIVDKGQQAVGPGWTRSANNIGLTCNYRFRSYNIILLLPQRLNHRVAVHKAVPYAIASKWLPVAF